MSFHYSAVVLILLLGGVIQSTGLNTDGILLLSFKFSILNDPLHVLENWNYSDETPCSWHGVTCGAPGENGLSTFSRVTGLSLANSQLLGSIPSDLGMVEFLQSLDLSNNSLNGSLPFSIFNATHLQFLDLSNNLISGQLPETIGRLQNLRFLNLSDNALAGILHGSITTVSNLTVVSLKNNYFSGFLPGGFRFVQVLDLSSNLINGSLPQDFGGNSVRYFNISYNKLSGSIPKEFASKIPDNATLDLSFNNLTGEIPVFNIFMNQKTSFFNGNPNLCGLLTKNPCLIPSSPTSPPAIAAIPTTTASTPATSQPSQENESQGLRKGTLIGIIVGDVAGVAILGMIFFYVYQFKKRRRNLEPTVKKEPNIVNIFCVKEKNNQESWSSSSSESKGFTRWSCLRNKKGENDDESDSTSSLNDNDIETNSSKFQENQEHEQHNKGGKLVTVDGEKELELESLLKASAYILGATGSSIMYKAVLEDGSSLAVRRIGENHVERFRDFENQVRVIAKLVHPNLVGIRGFYWGVDEKLIIYDFVPNGSLANARYRKVGSSPCHLPWEARLKIAKGVARGLQHLHDKKHVHGNLKPSNILLGSELEPRIGDFGLERLVTGDSSSKAGGSTRNFGSKRSSTSRDSFQEFSFGPSPSPSPSSIGGFSPYIAPESLRSLKPNPKWDIYSFGVILLELLTGKVIVVDELGQGNNGLVVDDKNRAIRMADVAIRADVEGKEEALLACFKLGYSCASPLPQKRPTMKEALQILEKIPCSSSMSFIY
ncbi:probable LRR receptor-like serine/threonine-protein kinase At4g37250 [Mercurialis annua]|uniref:probable LRR receptor-like serine/threonine-protein kinase At4g37250 n=1 Tax=Mercurialis annua TaxID=3986 RepID=UPI00216006AC|nr:probable LRR receptor-like serine/threonine-protein kinase At4g37250 [Mercurialis annua]XP_050206176.1 probable LRR receptor-like serine/threonine-protein kinase At4g37250 [Mercurialis annua]